MLVRGKCQFAKAEGAGNFYISIGDTGNKGAHVRISSSVAAATNYYYIAEGRMAGEYPIYYGAGGTVGNSSPTVSTNINPSSILRRSEYLPAFAIYTSTESVQFAAGSTFEIWGR